MVNVNVNDKWTLFPHQATATEWLGKRMRGCLWDEQGLGKTASAIVAARQIAAKRVLVVAPTVVAHNWAREIGRWAPGAEVDVVLQGKVRLRPGVDFTVVTMGMLLRPSMFEQLCQRKWDLAILDEGHCYKNPRARRSKAVYGLSPQLNKPAIVRSAARCWAMTGTPMPNHPAELWTSLAGLDPRRLCDEGSRRPMNWHQFRQRFCELKPSAYGDGWKEVGSKNVVELKQRLQGFALRRRKKDHLDLPPMRWGTVALTVEGEDAKLLGIEARHGYAHKLLAADDVTAFLSRMRDDEEFSTWRRLCGELKAKAAVELLVDELTETPGKKLVVFAHHKSVIAALAAGLEAFGVVTITGAQSASARQSAVDQFQTDPATRVCVANIVAGGVGITLTAASDAVMVEQSFVPGDNEQAGARLHRIGQTESVLIRVLTLAGSVDELLGEIVARKANTISQVLS